MSKNTDNFGIRRYCSVNQLAQNLLPKLYICIWTT